jgi:hypothetical protein
MRARVKTKWEAIGTRIQRLGARKAGATSLPVDALRNACICNPNTTDDHERLSNSLNEALAPRSFQRAAHSGRLFH